MIPAGRNLLSPRFPALVVPLVLLARLVLLVPLVPLVYAGGLPFLPFDDGCLRRANVVFSRRFFDPGSCCCPRVRYESLCGALPEARCDSLCGALPGVRRGPLGCSLP